MSSPKIKWSPALNIVKTDEVAAIPEEKPKPCLPFSNLAMRVSKSLRVGLDTRPYSNSCSAPYSLIGKVEAILIVLPQFSPLSLFLTPCMAFVSNFILVIIIILRATKVVHFLLPTKFILLKLGVVVYFSVLRSIIGCLFYAKPSFILRLSFALPVFIVYPLYREADKRKIFCFVYV